MKKGVLIMAACLVALAAVAGASISSSVFQIRLVVDAGTADSEQMIFIHKTDAATNFEPLVVQKKILLDGTSLKSVTFSPGDATRSPGISIVFTEAGRKELADITAASVGHRLAIIIDGQIWSAPIIRAPIPGGMATISGNMTDGDARDLAAKMNSLATAQGNAESSRQQPGAGTTSSSSTSNGDQFVSPMNNNVPGSDRPGNVSTPFSLPHTYKDPDTRIVVYIESDGRHVTAIGPDGGILWSRDPYLEAHLQSRRTQTPRINFIGKSDYGVTANGKSRIVTITYNSGQFGDLDIKTGDFTFGGAD